MIRSARMIFCDQEHGVSEMTYPSIIDLSETDFVETRTAAQLRRAAKKAGWSHVHGHDYCELCTEGAAEERERGREVLEVRQTGNGTLQLEKVKCGKPKCGRCKGGPAHGPYWYLYWKSKGRTRSKYIGKKLVPAKLTHT